MRLVALCELALAGIAGLIAAKLFWIAAAPLPRADEAPAAAERSAPAPAVDGLFRLAADPADAETGKARRQRVETKLNLALHGVWIDGAHSSAVIATPDRKQKTYYVGETICCAATLSGVSADHVEIMHDGARETLLLSKERSGRDVDARPLAAPAPASPAPAGHSLADIVRIQPIKDRDGHQKIQLFSGPDKNLFNKLGFRDGDIVVAVNGRFISGDAAGAAAALEAVKDASRATVVIERDGRQYSIEASLPDAPVGGG